VENIEQFVWHKAAEFASRQYANRSKQANVGDILATLTEKLRGMSPEQRRLILGTGGGALAGGLTGAVGATRNRRAGRSILGDALRGAVAGGAIGGGGSLAVNALGGGPTGVSGLIPGVADMASGGGTDRKKLDAAIEALDRERSSKGWFGGLTDAMYNNTALTTGGGATVGGALDAYDRFGTNPRANRFMEGLDRVIAGADTNTKENLVKLRKTLTDNKSLVPGVMNAADRHSTNTGTLADRWAKVRQGLRPSAGMRNQMHTDNTKGDTFFRKLDKQLAGPPDPIRPGAVVRLSDLPQSQFNQPGAPPSGNIGTFLGVDPATGKNIVAVGPGGKRIFVDDRHMRDPSAAARRFFNPSGKFTADTIRDASTGRFGGRPAPPKGGKASPQPTMWQRTPIKRTLTGGVLGLGASILPSLGYSLYNMASPSSTVSDARTGQILRDFGVID